MVLGCLSVRTKRGARKLALDTYSRVAASAGLPIELILAHTGSCAAAPRADA